MTHQYSYNDHYKWGFNDNWFNPPEREGFFQVTIGSCSRPPMSFREECINSARLLGEKLTKPILAGLSGGSDSQVVCLSLLNAKVPFTPVILKLFSSRGVLYNKFDIDGAFEFCKKHNLTPIVEELDLDEYYCTKLMPLVEKYCITNAEISVQLHLVEKYKDTHAYINGGGDPCILRSSDDETGESSLVYRLGPTPIEQYMMDHNIEGCLKFFMYTPEQIAAYFNHPVFHYYNGMRDNITDAEAYNCFTYYIKPMMYCDQWPELNQRRKNTGFEKYPFMRVVNYYVYKMYDHINPKSKMVVWKYEDILDHLLNGPKEEVKFRSIDERDYY